MSLLNFVEKLKVRRLGMRIKPLGNMILMKKRQNEEKKTVGGVLLPESVKDEEALWGKVIAVGTVEKIEVKKGDEIIISRYTGTQFESDGEELLLVKAPDVLAVIERK
jgi:chaperonin GroES